MKDVNWIEIGTSDFDTLAQTALNSEVGYSIEPISYYLNRLPDRPNVTKVNCAISLSDDEIPIDIYYIPGDVIDREDLPQMLRGCNSIGKYHYYHTHLQLEHLVVKEIVPQVPIGKFLTQHNIRGIGHLKIDTEGGDCYILKNLLNYLKDKEISFWPKMITFESNSNTPQDLLKETIDLYLSNGYVLYYMDSENTILILKG